MALGQSKSLLKKPKKSLPTKALQGKAGHSRGSGTDFQTLRVYDETPKPKPELPQNQRQLGGKSIQSSGGSGSGSGSGTSTYQGGVSGVGGSGGSGAGYSGSSTNGGSMPGGYTPEAYNMTMMSHPDAIAQDFLAGLGIDNAQVTDQYAPLLYNLNALTSLLGSDQAGELLDVAGQANQNNAYLTQLSTPGGQALDPGAIMAALANADPNSASGMYLASLTPEEVANFAMTLIDAAGGNPYQAKGLEAGFKQDARDYNLDSLQGHQGMSSRPYWEGIQNGTLGSFFGG